MLDAREVQDTFYLSHRKLVLGVWKRSEKKKSFDPHEVLSKLEDRRKPDGVLPLSSN